jgi:hypothetical protein
MRVIENSLLGIGYEFLQALPWMRERIKKASKNAFKKSVPKNNIIYKIIWFSYLLSYFTIPNYYIPMMNYSTVRPMALFSQDYNEVIAITL